MTEQGKIEFLKGKINQFEIRFKVSIQNNILVMIFFRDFLPE